MQVFQQQDEGRDAATLAKQHQNGVAGADADGLGGALAERRVVAHLAQQVQQVGQRRGQLGAQHRQAARQPVLDLRAIGLVGDAEGGADDLDERQVGRCAAVRGAGAAQEEGAFGQAQAELVHEAGLADPGLADDVDQADGSRHRQAPVFLQDLLLPAAADQCRQAPADRDVEAADALANGIQPPELLRSRLALQLAFAEVIGLDEAFDQCVGRLAHQHGAALGLRLDPGRQVDRVAERRGLHPPIIADGADDERPAVEADAEAGAGAVVGLGLAGHGRHPCLNVERGAASPQRRILDRHRRAEERHDPVTGHLLHRAALVMDGLAQLPVDALHQEIGLLLAEFVGERRVIGHVGEEYGHLTALRRASRIRRRLVHATPRGELVPLPRC